MNMKPAGYSGTPLAKKLGIKPGFVIELVNPPDYYFDLFTDWPTDIIMANDANIARDFIHFFTMDAGNLKEGLEKYKKAIKPNGIIWASWPKKASKVPTDVTGDIVRTEALKAGLVDIKVCAIDEIWSGLKLVIPVKDRK